MVYTSARPVTVDGVRLDTLAWNIEQINRQVSARRSSDYDVPNLDGVVASVNDALEPGSYGLQMWLRGTDVDGAVPGAGAMDTLRANMDEMFHLFGKRHALLEVREQVLADGTQRRAMMKVTDTIAPDLNLPGSAARFTVGLVIPAGLWEDVATSDWTQLNPVTAAEVTTMRGATERCTDGVFLVTGPATTPRITDPTTGMWVELGAALAAGSFWRFNSATWASRYGAGLGLGSSDTTGTDGTAITNVGGPSRAYGLPLVPVRDSGFRKTLLTLTAASGLTGASALSFRGRRKFSA